MIRAAGAIGRKGINRYIMECKCIHSVEWYMSKVELIDTLWNVNTFRKSALYFFLRN